MVASVGTISLWIKKTAHVGTSPACSVPPPLPLLSMCFLLYFSSCRTSIQPAFRQFRIMVVLYFSFNFEVVMGGGEYWHLPMLPSWFSPPNKPFFKNRTKSEDLQAPGTASSTPSHRPLSASGRAENWARDFGAGPESRGSAITRLAVSRTRLQGEWEARAARGEDPALEGVRPPATAHSREI